MFCRTLIACAALVASNADAADRVTGKSFATRSEVFAQHGMVATSQPLATQIGLDVLKRGGSAVDAAIAANAALGLMEPTGNGIGGDLFAIVWDAKSQKLHGYNGSGRSPRALSLKWFADNGHSKIPSWGPLPVTTPGAVDGWFALHGRFGKLPMKDVLAPAIGYARDGFPVSELIAYYWDRSVPRLASIGLQQQFTSTAARRAGRDLEERQSRQHARAIAKGGRDAFYRCDRAHDRQLHAANDGFLSYEDLAAHRGNGSSRCRPITVATRSGNCRRTARASPRCRC